MNLDSTSIDEGFINSLITEVAKLENVFLPNNFANASERESLLGWIRAAESEFHLGNNSKEEESKRMAVEMVASRVSQLNEAERVQYNNYLERDYFRQENLNSLESYLSDNDNHIYNKLNGYERATLGLSTLDSDGEKGPMTERIERDAKVLKQELISVLENNPNAVKALSKEDLENMPQGMKNQIIDAIDRDDNKELQELLRDPEVQDHLSEEVLAKLVTEGKSKHLAIEMAANPELANRVIEQAESEGYEVSKFKKEIEQNGGLSQDSAAAVTDQVPYENKQSFLDKVDDYKQDNDMELDPVLEVKEKTKGQNLTDQEIGEMVMQKSFEQSKASLGEEEDLSDLAIFAEDIDLSELGITEDEPVQSKESDLTTLDNTFASQSSTTGRKTSTSAEKTIEQQVAEATQNLDVPLDLQDSDQDLKDNVEPKMAIASVQQQQTGAALG